MYSIGPDLPKPAPRKFGPAVFVGAMREKIELHGGGEMNQIGRPTSPERFPQVPGIGVELARSAAANSSICSGLMSTTRSISREVRGMPWAELATEPTT